MTEPSQQLCIEGMTELHYSVTHHFIPRRQKDGVALTCVYCKKTEKEIRES